MQTRKGRVQVVACGGAGERPSFSYVCVEPNRAGTLLVDKCKQLQVRPGKKFSLLKEGRPVENAVGEVVTPHQVCSALGLDPAPADLLRWLLGASWARLRCRITCAVVYV